MENHVHIHLHQGSDDCKLDRILKTVKEIKMTQDEEVQLLTDIDTVTNAVGDNLTAIKATVDANAAVEATIKSEVDALLASPPADVPAPVVALLTGLSTKLGALKTASEAASAALALQVPVLTAIADEAKPVVPAPPEPVPAP